MPATSTGCRPGSSVRRVGRDDQGLHPHPCGKPVLPFNKGRLSPAQHYLEHIVPVFSYHVESLLYQSFALALLRDGPRG